MTRDDIIRMAREAGFITGETHASTGFHHPFVHPVVFASCLPELERFAALVAAAEREECATIDVTPLNILASDGPGTVILKYRAAIRARGQA